MRVVIVEDNAIYKEELINCLNQEAEAVDIVEITDNGAEGLAVIEKVRPDVVFTDIRMPEMDGFEMIEAIRRKHIFCKFVVVSSWSGICLCQEGDAAWSIGLSVKSCEIIRNPDGVKKAGRRAKRPGQVGSSSESGVCISECDHGPDQGR